MDERERRARSFGGVADEYERGRPEYPPEAVAWLVGDARVVVDLGAGTGKLTRGIAALGGREIVAVEPSEEMAARLRAAVPAARVLSGSAEEIPLGDGSADAVVAGQAYHWFDPARALPEIARVLRPGGTLGLVWNTRDDEVPWVRRLSELMGSESWAGRAVDSIDESRLFERVDEAEFRHEQRLERGALLDLVCSRSSVATLERAGRARLLEAVGRLYDETAGAAGVVLPYVTFVYRAARR